MTVSHLSIAEIFLRLGLTCLASVVLGFERESHGRAAGLRTTLLVGTAAAVAMILSESYYLRISEAVAGGWRPDPGRLAAGVLTGMGFLGAGAIIRQDNVIRGVTTAAVLWFVTVLGLAFGCGQIALGLIGFAIALVILLLLPSFGAFIKNDWYATVAISFRMDGPTENDIRRIVESFAIKIKDADMEYDLKEGRKTVRYFLKFKKGELVSLSHRVVTELARQPGILQVKWT
ncbi:MAG: MgtC/SapB family protein [Verrucomicrobiae bacterium]|nr:MgtC/SapB family protein [Verrucomicrobiae bacterium]